jgi:hypothetical protein
MELIGDTAKEVLQANGIGGSKALVYVGGMLSDNEHLKQFLETIPIQHRKEAYEQLKPHLLFKAKPYWLLFDGKVAK